MPLFHINIWSILYSNVPIMPSCSSPRTWLSKSLRSIQESTITLQTSLLFTQWWTLWYFHQTGSKRSVESGNLEKHNVSALSYTETVSLVSLYDCHLHATGIAWRLNPIYSISRNTYVGRTTWHKSTHNSMILLFISFQLVRA